MNMQKKYDISKEELSELRKKGYTKIELAKHFGCSQKTISDRLLHYGLSRKYLKRKDEFKLIEMAKIYTAEDIAKICDADLRTVYYWLQELGITAQHQSKQRPEDAMKMKKDDEIPKWKMEIYQYYGVMPDDDDVPDTKGVNCMKKRKIDCKYCSGTDCIYLLVEGHNRPCTPWNCTEYEQVSAREKRGIQSAMKIKGVE